MTIAAGKTPYHKYAPGSAMSAEAIPFEFLDPAHLTVQVVGGAVLTEGVDFALDGDWRAGSGTIRALIDAGAGEWELFSDTPDEQQLELAETRAVPLRQYERELDRAAIRARENRRDLGRTWKAPLGEEGPELPPIAERKGKFLGFSEEDGTPVVKEASGISQAELDAGLAEKADAAALAGKVDTEALDAALAGKADAAALAGKVDTEALDAALAGKADAAALAGKVDTEALDAALAQKANASDLSAKADNEIKQTGSGASALTIESKFRQFPTLGDYGTNAQAIAAAVAGNRTVGVLSDVTINIPGDAATLQIALIRLRPLNGQLTITLRIASGHSLAAGVNLSGGDYSQFRITSVDAEVPVSFNGATFQGSNGAKMPRLACLINAASQTSGSGISLDASSMTIEAGAGVKNCFGNGLGTFNGCVVQANGAIFSGCARSMTQNSGITSWASLISADGADCSNSGGYGCQAAHGGLLNFRQGNANNANRHGIRATDAAVVDADGATANGCGADGSGSNLRAYEGGIINFVNGTANGNLATSPNSAALFAFGAGSAINARLANSTGNARCAVHAEGGATVTATGGGSFTGSVRNYEELTGGRVIIDSSAVTAPSATPIIFADISSGNVNFIPDRSGVTKLQIDTENDTSSDSLDSLTPAPGYTIEPGHRVIIKIGTTSRTVAIRDVTASGVGGSYTFQTPGDSTILLANSASTAEFMWGGNVWLCLSVSHNDNVPTSGKYTPTVTPGANLTGTPTANAHFSREGDVVTVGGRIENVSPTAAGACDFEISLPIPSGITSNAEVGGTGSFWSTSPTSNTVVSIIGETSPGAAQFRWYAAGSATAQRITFSFTYYVK